MPVLGLDHFTLRCQPDELDTLRDFYLDVIGLTEGARADFDFAGHWLYAGGKAVVHLAADGSANDGSPIPSATGRLDHISFFTNGLVAFREKLRRKDVPFRELPVPGMPLHQLFVVDPTGLKIELTFSTADSEGLAR